MHVAGIDAHATYIVVAVVGNDRTVVHRPQRIRNDDPERLIELVCRYQPREVWWKPVRPGRGVRSAGRLRRALRAGAPQEAAGNRGSQLQE